MFKEKIWKFGLKTSKTSIKNPLGEFLIYASKLRLRKKK